MVRVVSLVSVVSLVRVISLVSVISLVRVVSLVDLKKLDFQKLDPEFWISVHHVVIRSPSTDGMK